MNEKIIKGVVIFLAVSILSILIINLDKITDKITSIYLKRHDIVFPDSDEYFLNRNFEFVQVPESYVPYGYHDLLNIFYAILDHGWTEFTFYCANEYTSCIEDAKAISKDKDLLTHLNNFVHPFHSADNMVTTLHGNGEIHVVVEYLYTEDEITKINRKVDEIYKKQVKSNAPLRAKLLTIHDYIINNSKYDVVRSSSKNSLYHSNIAYGPLFEGFATCNGYTDLMFLFLEKLGVQSLKVAKTPLQDKDFDGHVWNALYIENKWLHLDLTWDDPVSTDGKDYLQHNYYLLTTAELKEVDKPKEIIDHQFPTNIYYELKN